MNDKYTYKYHIEYLADGLFKVDTLGKLLADGYKPLREVNIGETGYILFILSKKVN
jgi:hypothetical protein